MMKVLTTRLYPRSSLAHSAWIVTLSCTVVGFCDLLTVDKRLIHVKRYSGSQQLCHLSSQGVVAGELFVQDADFRQKLNDKLPAAHKLANVITRPDPSEYEIVFAIISKSKNPLDIPFFSKVSLRNARRRLEGVMGIASRRKKFRGRIRWLPDMTCFL
jgi:uncharacterized protein (TIGR04141 family)